MPGGRTPPILAPSPLPPAVTFSALSGSRRRSHAEVHPRPFARASSFGWVIPADDAETAVALLRAHFPVVQDARQVAPQPPPFVDGGCDDPFRRLDLIAVLTPAAPALRAIYHDRHEARAAFAQLAAYDPTLPAQLGLAESLENQWVIASAAQRFWHELLSGVDQVVCGAVISTGM